MIYFPNKPTKILLILLCAIVTFHISLLSSKSISVTDEKLGTTHISEIQYEIYLSSIYRSADKAYFIKNTKIDYFLKLSPETFQYIYWSYFAIVALLIVFAKPQLKILENDKQ
jgi:hypothetical protein